MELDTIINEALIEIDGKKKLPCSQAFELAKKHGITLKAIGEYCNANNIKIAHCQLGCFR